MPNALQAIDPADLGVVARLLLAGLLGAVVGLERQWAQKPAGMRTNILICVGASLVMDLSEMVAREFGQAADPTRMAGDVVAGVGFIGAGAILVSRGHVVGITTAATIWVIAAIGLAVGSRAYVAAVATTVLAFIVLRFLRAIEEYFSARTTAATLEISIEGSERAWERLRESLRRDGFVVEAEEIEKSDGAYRVITRIAGPIEERSNLVSDLLANQEVRRAKLTR